MNYKEIKNHIGIVADDLTGAADAGLQFAKRGFKTLVLSVNDITKTLDINLCKDYLKVIPVLSINTGSRYSTASKAYELINNIFDLIKGRKLIYKKVDSALRGNIGAEIDAVMDNGVKDLTIFSAAFPYYKRYTIDGIHYLGDLPLSTTEISQDSVKPINNSNVVQIIQKQSQKKITKINYNYVTHGQKTLSNKIIDVREKGYQIIAIDAISKKDLDNIALAALKMENLPIFAGSAGLAKSIANILSDSKKTIEKTQKNFIHGRPILIVNGSTSGINYNQIKFLQNHNDVGIFKLSIDSVILEGYEQKQKIERAVDSICGTYNRKKIIVIMTERKIKKPNVQLSKQIVKILGLITKKVIEKRKHLVRGIILTGGDTADAVIKSLGACGIWIDAEVYEGVPFGFLFKGPYEGLPVITKAGAFGVENTLHICSEYLINNK